MSERRSYRKPADGSIYRKVGVLMPDGVADMSGDVSGSHYYTFIFFFQPGGQMKVDGQLVTCDTSAGRSMIAVSPGIDYQEVCSEEYRGRITVRIEEDLFRETAKQYTGKICDFRGEAFAAHPEILGVIRCFLLEKSDESQAHQELLDHLAQVIVHLTAHSIFSEINRVIPLYEQFEVEKAISYMSDHLAEKITLEDLARQTHRSSVHFSKIFKSVTSQTPVEFLQSLRLQRARLMLSCDARTISEIALECGFSTPSYFSSCFLDKYGTTPSAYREKYRQTD